MYLSANDNLSKLLKKYNNIDYYDFIYYTFIFIYSQLVHTNFVALNILLQKFLSETT